MKFFILGSCVTRDIFRVVSKPVLDYYSRTSIRSLVSDPMTIEENEIHLDSDFQRRMVKRDFEKTFFADIERNEFDYLIIDLIDERFDLIQIGKSVITRSNEYVNAGLEDVFSGSKLNKDSEGWAKDCSVFADRLLSVVPTEKIIIHEAYWANYYIEDRERKYYPNQANINSNNETLMEYYKILKSCIPAKVVKTQNELVGDPAHVWGLTPFHYTEDYYREIYDQIRA